MWWFYILASCQARTGFPRTPFPGWFPERTGRSAHVHEMRKVDVTTGLEGQGRLQCSACVLLIELGSGAQQLGPWRWLPLASLSLGPVHMPQFGRRSELLLRVTALLRLEVVKK